MNTQTRQSTPTARGNRPLAFLAADVGRAARLVVMLVRAFVAPIVRNLLGRPIPNDVMGARLRGFFEAMGITYIKIGQYLAMRFDILPSEVCRELGRLFESAPVVPFEVVRSIVVAELGAPLEDRFSQFAATPIASASVAQVHRATTADGQHVAVKVQRPGIAAMFASDMRTLRKIAVLVDVLGLAGRISTVSLVDEIAASMAQEMDFMLEREKAERLRRERARGSSYIPRIRPDLSTSRVMTMEYVDGVSLLRVQQLMAAGRDTEVARLLPAVDWQQVGTALTRTCMHQLVVTGFFHGDPHPGNVLIRRDGTVALVDFGIVGELSPDDRQLMRLYIANTVAGNIEEAWRAWLRLAPPTADTDMVGYRRESLEILARWHSVSSDPRRLGASRHIGHYQNLIIHTLRRYHVPLPPEHLLFWRVLLMLDFIAVQPPLSLDLVPLLQRLFAELESSPLERLGRVLTSPEANVARLNLAGVAPAYARVFLRDAASSRRVWRGVQHRPRVQDAGSRRAEVLPLVAVSLVVLSAGAGVPAPLWSTVFLAAAVTTLAALRRRMSAADDL